MSEAPTECTSSHQPVIDITREIDTKLVKAARTKFCTHKSVVCIATEPITGQGLGVVCGVQLTGAVTECWHAETA